MTSLVDVLIVAFLIYQFLALIKGRRAALILLGTSIIGLALYILQLEGLVTLTWLVAQIRPFALIVLIIVFAPELREALAKLGRSLTLTRPASAEADAYDDIVLAANL